jgi:Concanavalin A-like lectin/glucanases superfamily/Secretion system C-terminal sorting domain
MIINQKVKQMKIKNLLIGLGLIIGIITSGFAQVPTAGLIGYYPFTGNPNNLMGTNNGIVTGATLTTDRFGNINCAYNFNGVNDYIEIPSPYDLKTRTISIWFYATNIGSDSRLYSSDNANLVGGMTYINMSNNSGNDIINFYLGFNRASAPITKNVWHHVVMVVDSISGNEIYLDCQKLNTTVATLDKSVDGLAKTIIGSSRVVNGYFFTGKIDDIRIYNTALSINDIQALCNENLCYQHITVTDTLIINGAITGFNPITYKNTIKIFPNPTKDQITIDNGNFASYAGYTVKITNSLGQTIFTSLINQQQFTVNLSTWSGNGIYFVHIIDAQNNTIDIKKIVLQ